MMKYSTYTGDLLQALESASPASWKTPVTFIDSIHPNSQAGKNEDSKIRFNSQQIVSYCLGLCMQNQVLREIDLEPSLKRGSNKIKMLKKARNPQAEVGLELSAKGGTIRTRALVSLY